MESSFWTAWGTPAAISLIIGVITYTLAGRRERRRWKSDKRLDAYIDFIKQVNGLSDAIFKVSKEPTDEEAAQVALAYGRMHGELIHAVGGPRMVLGWLQVDVATRELINHELKGVAFITSDGAWTGHFADNEPLEYKREVDSRTVVNEFRVAKDRLREAVRIEAEVMDEVPFRRRLKLAWGYIRRGFNRTEDGSSPVGT